MYKSVYMLCLYCTCERVEWGVRSTKRCVLDSRLALYRCIYTPIYTYMYAPMYIHIIIYTKRHTKSSISAT